MLKNNSDINFSEEKKYKLIFFFLCAAWFILWSIIPLAIYEGPYVDTTENIAIGREFSFGYDKHPYFGVWIMRLIFTFSGGVWPSFIFSQIAILVFLISTWKLAGYFLSPAESLVSIIFLLANPVYSISAILFNQNVILIAFWALIILFFYKALLNQKYSDWILLGIFCGLGLMTKYFCVFLFLPMALWLLFTPQGRKSFSKIGLYLCFISFLAVVTPNIIWLINNDFASILYASQRSEIANVQQARFLNHILSPLSVAGMVLGSFTFSLIAFFVCFRKKNNTFSENSDKGKCFIYFMTLCPLILVMVFTMIFGTIAKGDWLLTLCGMFGIFAVIFWKPYLEWKRIKFFIISLGIYVFLGIFLHGAFVLLYTPYIEDSCLSFCAPTYSFANDIEASFKEKYHKNIKYVCGDVMLAGRISVFSKDNPIPVFLGDYYSHRNSVFAPDYKQSGTVIIWNGINAPKAIDDFKPYHLSEITTKSYPRLVKAWFKYLVCRYFKLKPKNDNYSFAFIEPQD